MRKISLLFLFLLTSMSGFCEVKQAVVGDYKYEYDTDAMTATVIQNVVGERNYSGLKDAVIPSTIEIESQNYNVTAIAGGAFVGSKIETITFPSTLTTIGEQAFNYTLLRSVVIPKSVTDCYRAFLECDLENIVVDSDNPIYDSRDNCNAIIRKSDNCLIKGSKNTIIPNTVTSMVYDAFYHSSIESIVIPASLVEFKESYFTYTPFCRCNKLTSLVVDNNNPVFYSQNNTLIETSTKKLIRACNTTIIPDDIKIIGSNSFSYLDITEIIIPENVLKIQSGAFTMCEKLTSVLLPEGLTELGEQVFYGCKSLESITLPSTLTTIGNQAFHMPLLPYKLKTVISQIADPFDIPEYVFISGAGNLEPSNPELANLDITLIVPTGKKGVYASKTGWNTITNIVEEGTENDITYFENADNTITVISSESTGTEVEIPEQVNGKEVSEIGANAFAGKTGVTDIVLPETEKALELGTNALKIDDDHMATVHVPLSLLVDYALNGELKQNFEAGKVVATITAPNQYWTFSSGVDVLVPDGVKVYICKAINGSDIQIVELTDAELTVDGKKVIKANNGVLISSTSGNAYDLVAKSGAQASGTIPAAFDNANSYEGNKLVPVVRSENYDPDQYYMLYNGGFVKIADGDVSKTPACRALLKK